MTATDVGALLRHRREDADVTRAELAHASGVTSGTVGAIERGQATREVTLRRLAWALAAVAPDVGIDADRLVEELLSEAGDGLAAPSAYPEQAAHRERQRDRQAQPELAALQRWSRVQKAAIDRAIAAGDMAAVVDIARRELGR